MGDKRQSGGGIGGGTWNFLTKTLPSVSAFVTTAASKWLSEQDLLEEQQRDAELEKEIQGQISRISELLREQDRPLARDGNRNLDMEIQHQLARIQELLVETKNRGGRLSDEDMQHMKHWQQVQGAKMSADSGASVHSGHSSSRGSCAGVSNRSAYADMYIDTALPTHTPTGGSDTGWPAPGSEAGWSLSSAASTPAPPGAAYWSNHSSSSKYTPGSRPGAPASASSRLDGGGGGHLTPSVAGGGGGGGGAEAGGYPETPPAARSMRLPARMSASDKRDLLSGDEDAVAKQLSSAFRSPANAGGMGALGSGGQGSVKGAGPGQRVGVLQDQDELKTLFSRARHGRYKEVEAMLQTGISADVRDEYGNTLLTIAAQNGNKRIVKICLRRGCNINAQNFRGQTALHYSYAFGYAELAGYLESKGANAEVRNEFGLTAREGLEANDAVLDLDGGVAGLDLDGGVAGHGGSSGMGLDTLKRQSSRSRSRGRRSHSGLQSRRDEDEESQVSINSRSTLATSVSGVSDYSISASSYASGAVDMQSGDVHIPHVGIREPVANYGSHLHAYTQLVQGEQEAGAGVWRGSEGGERVRASGGERESQVMAWRGVGGMEQGAEKESWAEAEAEEAHTPVRDSALLLFDDSAGGEEEGGGVREFEGPGSHLKELAMTVRRKQVEQAQRSARMQQPLHSPAPTLHSPTPPLHSPMPPLSPNMGAGLVQRSWQQDNTPSAPLAKMSRDWNWSGGLLGGERRGQEVDGNGEGNGDGDGGCQDQDPLAATFPPMLGSARKEQALRQYHSVPGPGPAPSPATGFSTLPGQAQLQGLEHRAEQVLRAQESAHAPEELAQAPQPSAPPPLPPPPPSSCLPPPHTQLEPRDQSTSQHVHQQKLQLLEHQPPQQELQTAASTLSAQAVGGGVERGEGVQAGAAGRPMQMAAAPRDSNRPHVLMPHPPPAPPPPTALAASHLSSVAAPPQPPAPPPPTPMNDSSIAVATKTSTVSHVPLATTPPTTVSVSVSSHTPVPPVYAPVPPSTPPPPHVKPIPGFSPGGSGYSSPMLPVSGYSTPTKTPCGVAVGKGPGGASPSASPGGGASPCPPKGPPPPSAAKAKWLLDDAGDSAAGAGPPAPPPTPLNVIVGGTRGRTSGGGLKDGGRRGDMGGGRSKGPVAGAGGDSGQVQQRQHLQREDEQEKQEKQEVDAQLALNPPVQSEARKWTAGGAEPLSIPLASPQPPGRTHQAVPVDHEQGRPTPTPPPPPHSPPAPTPTAQASPKVTKDDIENLKTRLTLGSSVKPSAANGSSCGSALAQQQALQSAGRACASEHACAEACKSGARVDSAGEQGVGLQLVCHGGANGAGEDAGPAAEAGAEWLARKHRDARQAWAEEQEDAVGKKAAGSGGDELVSGRRGAGAGIERIQSAEDMDDMESVEEHSELPEAAQEQVETIETRGHGQRAGGVSPGGQKRPPFSPGAPNARWADARVGARQVPRAVYNKDDISSDDDSDAV